MPIAQISPNSITADPSHVNPQVKANLTTTVPQANQDAQKATQAIKTDTVTISPQAVQMLASDGDTAVQEAKEGAAEKATEKLKGKK